LVDGHWGAVDVSELVGLSGAPAGDDPARPDSAGPVIQADFAANVVRRQNIVLGLEHLV